MCRHGVLIPPGGAKLGVYQEEILLWLPPNKCLQAQSLLVYFNLLALRRPNGKPRNSYQGLTGS